MKWPDFLGRGLSSSMSRPLLQAQALTSTSWRRALFRKLWHFQVTSVCIALYRYINYTLTYISEARDCGGKSLGPNPENLVLDPPQPPHVIRGKFLGWIQLL